MPTALLLAIREPSCTVWAVSDEYATPAQPGTAPGRGSSLRWLGALAAAALCVGVLTATRLTPAADPIGVADTIRTCATDSSRDDADCLREPLLALIQMRKVDVALHALNDVVKEQKYLPMCHGVAHELGRSSYRVYGDVATALAAGEPMCSGGYFHGVLEGAAQAMGSARFLTVFPTLCDSVTKEDLEQCIHGLGHAAYTASPDDLTVGDRHCTTLKPRGDEVYESCLEGMFMGWVPEQPRRADISRLRLCDSFDGDLGTQCLRNLFQEQSVRDLEAAGGLEGWKRFCDEQVGASLVACYGGIGSRSPVLVEPVQASIVSIVAMCGPFGSSDRYRGFASNQCLRLAINGWAWRHGTSLVAQFCELPDTQPVRPHCLKALEELAAALPK